MKEQQYLFHFEKKNIIPFTKRIVIQETFTLEQIIDMANEKWADCVQKNICVGSGYQYYWKELIEPTVDNTTEPEESLS